MASGSNMMSQFHPVLQVGLGIVVGYLAATLWESYSHNRILHARVSTREFWRRHPRIFWSAMRGHYAHSVVHHGLTFRQDFVTQFESAEERADLDALLPEGKDGELIRYSCYGNSIYGFGTLIFLAPIPVLAPLFYYLVGPWSAVAAIPTMTAPLLLSMIVHPFIHLDQSGAQKVAPKPVAWLLRTRYLQAAVKNHYVHHEQPDRNFNLLLGGDVLWGVHRAPTEAELSKMESLGLLSHSAEQSLPERATNRGWHCSVLDGVSMENTEEGGTRPSEQGIRR
jgi:hypothetical protein